MRIVNIQHTNIRPVNLFVIQKFFGLIVSRFQIINLKQEGAKVKHIQDVKNEIKIITLLVDIFGLWEEFLERHNSRHLINPETRLTYNSAQSFHPKSCSLKREFFKNLKHFTAQDLWIYVQHLTQTTPNRALLYPKFSVTKPKSVIVIHHTASHQVKKRKRKIVVIEENIRFLPELDLMALDLNVKEIKWRHQKNVHRFSTTPWDFLLYAPRAAYFTKRLTNEGIYKRIINFVEKFVSVYDMFKALF